jgi:hypothetical protein
VTNTFTPLNSSTASNNALFMMPPNAATLVSYGYGRLVAPYQYNINGAFSSNNTFGIGTPGTYDNKGQLWMYVYHLPAQNHRNCERLLQH